MSLNWLRLVTSLIYTKEQHFSHDPLELHSS